MRGLFSLDGGLFSGMGKIVDIVLVSVIYTFFCMPVITIGPATSALYYVTTKVIRKERGYVFQEFWKCFKQNFLTGIIYTGVILVIGFLMYFNFNVINVKDTKTNLVLFYIYWMFLFVIGSAVVYLFPLLSRFTLKRVELVKMALFVSMKHLPNTLFVLALTVFTAFAMLSAPLLTSFMPGLCCLLCSLRLEKVFKKYLPAPDENIPEEELEWYYTF
ncbi:MAG: YesL family protein [bacterium]|nr:YesL family protein [bacterium]